MSLELNNPGGRTHEVLTCSNWESFTNIIPFQRILHFWASVDADREGAGHKRRHECVLATTLSSFV